MPTTLLVTYLPRGERSQTKRLVDTFLAEVKNKSTEVQHLDLLKDTPDLFMEENVSMYYRRNYGGEKLSAAELKPMAKMDRMTAQFKAADIVVLAYPIYNFSFPAVVKAYFDSVMLKGETWDRGPEGFVGLMTGKKAMILSSSAGDYTEANGNLTWDHSSSLGRQELQFMNFKDIEVINAGGMSAALEVKEEVIAKAQTRIKEVVQKWY